MAASNPDFHTGAHTLLNKPTLEITPEEENAIFADLRQRRERFLQGQQDKPPAKRAPAKTKEEKEAVTSSLLDEMLATPIGGAS